MRTASLLIAGALALVGCSRATEKTAEHAAESAGRDIRDNVAGVGHELDEAATDVREAVEEAVDRDPADDARGALAEAEEAATRAEQEAAQCDEEALEARARAEQARAEYSRVSTPR